MPRKYKTPARDAMLANLKALGKPVSIPELQAMFPGLSRGAIVGVLKSAHIERLIRIAGWRHNLGTRGRISPLYGIANGDIDAVKPVALDRLETQALANRRYRRRHGAKLAFKAQIRRKGVHPSFTGFVYKPRIKPLELFGNRVHKIFDTDDEDA